MRLHPLTLNYKSQHWCKFLRNVTIEKGELATSVAKKIKTTFVYLDDAGNDKLRTSLIAFIFGVLVNVGK